MPSKNFIRWVIAAFLIATFQSYALTTTIVVNTTADENGSNLAACSLREALAAAKKKAAFGGCTTGAVSGNNLIQLDAGTYNLTLGELTVATAVTIAGKDTVRPDELNPYTGQKPNRLRADSDGSATIIHATPGAIAPGPTASRIFNTSADIILRDLVLTGNYPLATAIDSILTSGEEAAAAVPGDGGILYAGASVTLENVIVTNAYVAGGAAYKGGAIYLSRNDANLSITDTTFRFNRANGSGGVIAMVCTEDGRDALHDVSANRVLFESNGADAGAGVIEVCGNSKLAISTSTLSANRSVASGLNPTGAIAYNQASATADIGSVALTFITAAEHSVGPVLSFKGLSSIALGYSVLINNAQNCQVPLLPLKPATGITSGVYNAIEGADPSTNCNVLLSTSTSPSANNVIITTSLATELLPLGNYGGLVNGYLPRSDTPTFPTVVINAAGIFSNCSVVDQRGFVRKSGTFCDRGAMERLEATQSDDLAVSTPDTDRLAIVDVLANDFFGESDDGPNKYADIAITLVDNPRAQCAWIDSTNINTLYPDHPEYLNRLIVQHIVDAVPPATEPVSGTPTGTNDPVKCTYVVRYIAKGTTTPISSAAPAATVSSTIKNVPPRARDDIYVRPVGVASISINPIENDNDDGDGVYGKSVSWPAFPVYVASGDVPVLGKLEGTLGKCPDYTSTNPKLCYAVPFNYVASNSSYPFTDSFSYSLIDKDGSGSAKALVTIKTDAPNPDEGQTGGSLDIFGGFFLVLLGLRRMRKL